MSVTGLLSLPRLPFLSWCWASAVTIGPFGAMSGQARCAVPGAVSDCPVTVTHLRL